MKKAYQLIIFLFSVTIFSNAQLTNFQWAKQLGGINDDRARSITTDALGNVYTTGLFYGTCDFDPGPGVFNLSTIGQGVFISKLDAFGNFVWAKNVAPAGGFGTSIAIDGLGNVIINGGFLGTADFDPGAGVFNLSAGTLGSATFILKLSSSGAFVWAKAIGVNATCIGLSVFVDGLDNIYSTGYFYGTGDFNPGIGTFNLTSITYNADIFISKLDVNGNFIWAKQIGGSIADEGTSIAVDAIGNVFTTGAFNGVVDFDPGAGTYTLASQSYTLGNTFLNKLDQNGNFVWAKCLAGTGISEGQSIKFDNVGNIYIAGNFENTVDFDPNTGIFNITSFGSNDGFICKLDALGNFVWAKNIGGSNDEFINSMIIDSSNNIYAAGHFYGTSDFDPGVGTYSLTALGFPDAFIFKLDAFGNFIFANSFGGVSDTRAFSITADAVGNIYTTGYITGTADFDQSAGIFNLSSFGDNDIFIHKMSQTPVGIIENTLQNNISIYPNPAKEIVNIDISKGFGINNLKIEIVNLFGQVLISDLTMKQNFSFNIQHLPPGLYFLKVISDDKIISTQKIVKE